MMNWDHFGNRPLLAAKIVHPRLVLAALEKLVCGVIFDNFLIGPGEPLLWGNAFGVIGLSIEAHMNSFKEGLGKAVLAICLAIK